MCIVHNNGVFLIARFFYLLHFLIFFDSCSFYHTIFADYSKQLYNCTDYSFANIAFDFVLVLTLFAGHESSSTRGH